MVTAGENKDLVLSRSPIYWNFERRSSDPLSNMSGRPSHNPSEIYPGRCLVARMLGATSQVVYICVPVSLRISAFSPKSRSIVELL